MDKYRPCPSLFCLFTSGSQHPPRSTHAVNLGVSVKAVTLIFISGRDLAISSTHEGKTSNINGKTETFNCLLRVDNYKLERSVAYWINIPLSKDLGQS